MSSALLLRASGANRKRASEVANAFLRDLERGVVPANLTDDVELLGRTRDRIRWDRMHQLFAATTIAGPMHVFTRAQLVGLPEPVLNAVLGRGSDSDMLVMTTASVDFGPIRGEMELAVAIDFSRSKPRIRRMSYPAELIQHLSGSSDGHPDVSPDERREALR